MKGNMNSLLRKNYYVLNWICLGTCVLSSSMMSTLTRSPIVEFTPSNVMETVQPNTTDQEMHTEETGTKPGSRFDSNRMSPSPTKEPSLSRIKDTTVVTEIQKTDDYDKSLMLTMMEDCQSIDGLQQDWSFDYKYTRDEVNSLLCRCVGVCSTMMPNIQDVLKLREYFHNPVSDINLTRFIIVMSVYSTLFLIGVIGNATTIVGLLKWVRSKTPTLSFILSMAIIDLMLLLICVPLKVAETFEFTHDIGLVRCKLLYYFRDFTFVCSIFTMSVISFERYYAICHPLEAQYKCTKKRTRFIIITIWILSAIFAAPTIFAMKSYTSVYDMLGEQTCRQNFSKDIYMQLFCTYYLGILFLLPLLVMLYTYGCSCMALKKSANRSKVLQNIGAISTISFDGSGSSEKEGHNYQGRIKVIKMLIIILITFTFCWGPSLIFRVLVIYKISIANRWLITQIFDVLIFINSCSSPYIFMCMSSNSVKTCRELWKTNGLYCITLVKTAHKNFPTELLREKNLARGEWTSALAEIDGLKVTATRFIDLQEKLFISSCSTDLEGPPRVTKHHGDVKRPQVAYDYLSNSASIDIHNHFRTGSVGLEDAWQTKSAHMQQFAGVLGFLFTNGYLAYNKFQKSSIKHWDFKIKLANALMEFKENEPRPTRNSLEHIVGDTQAKVHVLKLMEKPTADKDGCEKQYCRYQRGCFYCQHNPNKKPEKHKTSYHCEGCVGPRGQLYPLCEPKTGRECFKLHIVNGLPPKRRYTHN